MEDFIPLYYYVSDAFFFGFGVITIILLLPYRFYGSELQPHMDRLYDSIRKCIRLLAIVCLLIQLGFLVKELVNGRIESLGHLFGEGWGYFWIKLIFAPILCLFLWIPRVFASKTILFIMALLVGFIYLVMTERFIIISSHMHMSDFEEFNMKPFYKDEMYWYYGKYLLEQLFIFGVLLLPYHFLRIRNISREVE